MDAFQARPARTPIVILAAISTLLLVVLAPHAEAAKRAKLLGVPQAPRVVYKEDFENGMARAPVLLSQYQGAPPLAETYGAAPRFLENCNGYIVEFESNERAKKTDCEEVAYNRVRQMAWVLGDLRGGAPLANHAVSAYTDGKKTLPANSVQFETLKPIPVSANGRFITFTVDAAETNCGSSHAELKFYLLDGAAEIPTFTSPIDPCTNKNSKVIEPPELGTKAAAAFKTGTFAANAATLFTGTSLGIRMRNAQTSESGNDAAFDNIEVLDATPRLEKAFSPSVLSVGETTQLTFTITNTSELAAKEGWSFSDDLPAGLVVASPARGATTCAAPTTITAIAGGSSIAVKGNLAAEMSSCVVTVEVTSGTEGTYVNGPKNTTETGIDPPGDTPVTFADNADLAIEKSASPVPGVPGSQETFTLRVENKGPDTAKQVVVTDPLPAGLTFVSAKAPCDRAGSGPVRCELGSLASGDSVTLQFVVEIPDSATDGFVNTAVVTSPTPDPDLSNNSDTVPVPLAPEADLQIRKVALPTKLVAGSHVAYVLLVHNAGPSDATDVTVTDPLAPALHLDAARASQGSCSIRFGLICRLGSIRRGASAAILVIAQVSPDSGGTIPNTATVAGGQIDPNPSDNESSAAIEVEPLPPKPLTPEPIATISVGPQPISDLAVVKRVDRANARVGERLTYTLEVTNRGPDDAANVRVTDTWTLGMKVVSVHPSKGSCQRTVPLQCNLGRLRNGESARIRIVATVPRPGQARNTATVASSSRDPNPGNNQSSAEATIRPKPRPAPAPIVTG